ncbi:hypothetical protein L249_2010 [Ophiocordyceps polyrhachis-furcata BCC 54312]|uniref:Uncharacterized protein n=1 Tax=Ophiocordyceps polyrhachis-furcata BCC 54312 TaxID=1330021 RepID=A0A367LN66_9HYPO|nr:hypothetical protein L249_2010 [Ophiocordyceps polyrhachis-furcata BCC 54312]
MIYVKLTIRTVAYGNATDKPPPHPRHDANAPHQGRLLPQKRPLQMPLVANNGKRSIYLHPGHRFRDPDDGKWYVIVTWTRNMSIHDLYFALHHKHPLHPGLQCYFDYGAGCWQGWKTLGCHLEPAYPKGVVKQEKKNLALSALAVLSQPPLDHLLGLFFGRSLLLTKGNE